MNKIGFKRIIVFAVSITALTAFSQCSVPDFGQDREKAEVMNARYSDALREGKHKEAKAPAGMVVTKRAKAYH